MPERTQTGRLITLNALVGLAAGVALLVVPDLFLSVLGLTTDSTGHSFARLYRAELLGFLTLAPARG